VLYWGEQLAGAQLQLAGHVHVTRLPAAAKANRRMPTSNKLHGRWLQLDSKTKCICIRHCCSAWLSLQATAAAVFVQAGCHSGPRRSMRSSLQDNIGI
jgi:hypothetical protein